MRRDAIALGYSDDELRRLARSGEWFRLRRGAYLEGPQPTSAPERHRLLVHATMAGLRRPAVVSHQSAAVLHGLALWSVRLDRVHVTRRPPAVQDTGRVLRCHVARLRADEVVEVDGMPVTSPVRTVLDLARSVPLEPAVVALDGALHGGAVEHGQLRIGLGALFGTPGSRRAARAVELADGRSESVGESRSRVVLHRHGVPPSGSQFEVRVQRSRRRAHRLRLGGPPPRRGVRRADQVRTTASSRTTTRRRRLRGEAAGGRRPRGRVGGRPLVLGRPGAAGPARRPRPSRPVSDGDALSLWGVVRAWPVVQNPSSTNNAPQASTGRVRGGCPPASR